MDSGSEPGMTKKDVILSRLVFCEMAKKPVSLSSRPPCRDPLFRIYHPYSQREFVIPASGRQIEQQSKRSVDYNETFAEIL
jgi:hypothetical protein